MTQYSPEFKSNLYKECKVEILRVINTYREAHNEPPLFSYILENVRVNRDTLIHEIARLTGEDLTRLTAEGLPLRKVVREDPYFLVDITPKGIEVLRRADK